MQHAGKIAAKSDGGSAARRPECIATSPRCAPHLQRKCECGGDAASGCSCDKKKRTLQRKADSSAAGGEAPSVVYDVIASSGRPLDRVTRELMEAHFGRDLSHVRIHTDAQASQSAEEVSASAYTIGNHVVFRDGKFAPQTNAGRQLLVHELAHTFQQDAMPLSFGGTIEIGAADDAFEHTADAMADTSAAVSLTPAAPPQPPLLQRDPDDLAKRIAQLRKTAKTDPAAAEELRQIYHDMPTSRLARYARSENDPFAQAEYESRNIPPAEAEGQGQFSKPEMQKTLEDDIEVIRRDLSEAGVTRRTRTAWEPEAEPEGGTVGSARTDIPGLENQRFIGRSPRAGGEVNPESHFPPATDPEVLPHTHGHAEQSIADQLEAALEKIPVEQLKGRRVYMPIEQEPCSTCAQGVNNLETEAGVLVRLSKRFPEVIFEVRSLDSSAIIVLQNGVRVGGGAAGGAAKGTPNAGEPVQVETQIEVLDAVTHPDGSVTSQIEYKFGQNLENINKGAPPGGELPAKIVVKVTQNADGSIASVESLSGQPQALAEALVRQTLPDALAGAETGAAEGALEGAVAKAAVLAKVSKGLKIGGWAAFVVITGYQLITATPEERPRVVTAAAGGLAGGVVGSYVVCNLIFGLETLGWSLLFCGLVAGGAGGYVGSEVAGDIYDEATRTKLQEALQKLDASPRNVRILFNAVVNRLGPDGLPIDDSFVNRFLAIVPSDLRNYELIVLAGRFAAAAGVRAPKQPTAAQKAATHAPTTSFPTFTQRSDCKVNCHRGADDLRGFDVIDGRPVSSAEDFANMEKWIESQRR